MILDAFVEEGINKIFSTIINRFIQVFLDNHQQNKEINEIYENCDNFLIIILLYNIQNKVNQIINLKKVKRKKIKMMINLD